jgi:hypothetical protein
MILSPSSLRAMIMMDSDGEWIIVYSAAAHCQATACALPTSVAPASLALLSLVLRPLHSCCSRSSPQSPEPLEALSRKYPVFQDLRILLRICPMQCSWDRGSAASIVRAGILWSLAVLGGDNCHSEVQCSNRGLPAMTSFGHGLELLDWN